MNRGINRDGFSLMELLVVISIIGILIALAVPSYFNWKPGHLARGAVSQIAGDLNKVKMRTVETRREARVTFNTNGYSIEDGNRVMNSTQWGNIDSNGVFTAGTALATKDFSNYPGVYLSAVPALPINFSPRGAGVAGMLTATHDDHGSIDIVVNLTGGVDVRW